MRNNKGFTLVEILIVVIILGILAAIVIPQFTEASNDARESALASDLQTMRSQVELYKIQHLDCLPGDDQATPVVDVTDADFVADLTVQTDQDGTAGTTFGPYLQTFPSNPFVSGATTNTITSGAGASPGNGLSGWWLNTTTGKVSPNDAQGYATW
jgi:general secretion pathway protein G